MRRDRTTTVRRTLRLATVGFVVALGLTAAFGGRVEAGEATDVALSSQDATEESPEEPTEPPPDETPDEPTKPPADETPEEPTAPEDETAPDDAAEPAPEPGDVPAAVWVGAMVLLLIAVVFSVWHSSKASTSAED